MYNYKTTHYKYNIKRYSIYECFYYQTLQLTFFSCVSAQSLATLVAISATSLLSLTIRLAVLIKSPLELTSLSSSL